MLLCLETRRLGADKTQDYYLILRHLFQGLERAGTLIVVLEQKPLSKDTPKDGTRNRVISALDQPPAALVAASEVESKSDPWGRADHCIIHLNPPAEPLIDFPPLTFVEDSAFGIE